MKSDSNTRIVKSLAIAAATVALAAPFSSQARNDEAAIDTCVNAFVAASLPKDMRVVVRKEDIVDSPISHLHSRAYKIVLSARGVGSGKFVARGTCLVDRTGQVIALNGKPLTQNNALTEKVAAR